jgi:ribosome-associated protein
MATKSSAKSSRTSSSKSASRGKRKIVKRAASKPAAKRPAAKAGKTLTKKKNNASRVGKSQKSHKPAVKKKAAKKSSAPVKKVAKVASPTPVVKAPPKSPLLLLVEAALADMKAVNVSVLDVRGLTDVADSMVIASGNSDRHVRSIADNVVQAAKKAGFRPMGVEGERDGEWALVDLQDIIVHVMLPRVREFYRLENLWDISAARRESALSGG